ncbi:MAG TPA: hypothetical protein IAD20_04395 [Candidatus Scatocola faecipullorum]|jgi:hypothetical protein|uniref:Phage MuF C-terminal domain-containing protein n=1 Tax=Candidatus Scatocola faecipullorum TaxID=2840917 RepID=A0A9D1SBB6_9PROT|nr:hypothetical protein [Candidatus Scatocola faecipullorum]
MKPWEMNWEQGNTAIEPASATPAEPWNNNWQQAENPEIDVNAYNGTSLIGEPGEDAKPFEKMSLFMKKLFTFEVRDAAENRKNNPRIQTLEKLRREGFDDVKWGEVGKSAVRGFFEVGKGVTASPLKIYGDWAMDNRDTSLMTPREKAEVKRNNFHASLYKRLGEGIEKLWNLGLNAEWLKQDEEIFEGSFVENPSMTRALSLGASAAPSIGWLGGLAKLTGSTTLASVMLAGADADDIYFEAREAGASQNKALSLFAAGTAGTAAFDKYGFERMFSQKVTAPLAKRVVNSMLSEGVTEGTQTLWQNMVKKYGYDDSQELWEAVIESVIGGALSGGAVSAANAGYIRLQDVRGRLKEKGMTDNGLDQVQETLVQEMGFHREGLEPLFQTRIEQSLNKLDDFVKQSEETADAKKTQQIKADLDEVYNKVFERIKTSDTDKVAAAQAKVVQGVALWGSQELGISPLEYFEQRFPRIERVAYRDFARRLNEAKRAGEVAEINLYEALKNPAHLKGQKVKDTRQSLTQFLKQNGGLKDFGGELKAMDADKQVIGLINNKNGRNLDDMALAAWEAGYFPQNSERPTVNDLLDAIGEELGGRKRYNEEAPYSLEDEVNQLAEDLDRINIDWRNMEAPEIEMAVDAYMERQRAYNEEMGQEDIGSDELPWFQLPVQAYNKQGKADVNSEAFKRWFGDSKVVDESGQPLKMVHFSGNEFSQFDKNRTGINNDESAVGFWFADKDDFAFNNEYHPVRYDVYLKMDNPLIIEGKGTETNPWADTDIDNLDPYTKFEKMFNDLMYQDPQMWDERVSESLYGGFETQKIKLHFANLSEERKREVIKSIVDKLKTQGHDGIIIKNTQFDSVNPDEKINQYVVFEPNQIKSVYNRGTFDPNNDNIYYQAEKVAFSPSNQDKRTYIEDLRAVERGEDSRIRVGELPVVYQELGLSKGLVRTNKDVILKDSIKKHSVPQSVVENLPDLFADPLMVMDSRTVDGRLLAVVDAVDSNGQQIVVAIAPNTKGEKGYHFIPSFYGKNKLSEFIETNIREGNLKYLKSSQALDSLQLRPQAKTLLNSLDNNILQKSDIVKTMYQDQTLYRDPKGAFSQRIDRRAVISLFERADASTFMHETAHFFFEELKAFAPTSEKSAQMLKTVNDWLGSDGASYTVEQTEQFARGFEQYLREGKAPSSYLKRVFDAFMNWMRNLYKTAKELNVKLNDEVRGVYGEILGGADLDRYMDAPVAEVLGQTKRYWKAKREAMDDIYKQNVDAKKASARLFKRGRETMQNVYTDMRNYLSDAIVPLEEEIKQISPELYNMNRRLEIDKLQKTSAYYKRVKGFVDGMQKMDAPDFYTFDLALKNRDVDTVQRLLEKYALTDGFAEVRNILDDLREQMIDVGVDVAYMPDYFPRKIKDADGLLDYVEQEFGGRPEYSIIQKMIEEKRKDGRIRTKEDEAQIVNSLIRGYAGGISIAKIGNVKERSIDVVDQYMNRFYKVSTDALTDYISGAVQMIENKKYFGRETKELQNLRKMVANRETTIADYKAMEPKEAKWKEIKARNYKIGAVEAQIRNTYDKDVKAELQDRKTKLEAEVEFLRNRRAEQVKEIAINRMEVELAQVKKEVDDLADSKIENSVGNLLLEMAEQGKISHTQELRLKELLLARFSNQGLGNEFLRLLRDGGYIWTLGNFESAITQFGDLGTSAYKNGLWNTAFEYVKAWQGKSEITINDLGLEKIIQDGGYADTSAWSKALDKVLKYTGFEKMDKIAKQTLVNSAVRKARADAKAESPELEAYLRHEFGEKWVDVKEDLKTGAVTDEIMEYAMFQLLDVQPITIDQMPRYYAEGGKKRLFYMMKSYFIKQLNEYRKICFETAKSNPRKAVVDMTRLTVYLMLFNAGADVLKDLLFGRPVNVPDSLVDNIFIGGSINRYQAMSVKREGLFKTLQKQLLFPVMLDELVVDILSDKEVKNWETWKNVPWAGRPWYWWIGGGHLKTLKEEKKARNERRNQRRRRRDD